jgi:hypothetical protein
MPVPIPGADLQATSSRSAHYQGHQRLLDEEEEIGATPYLPTRSRSGEGLKNEDNVGKYIEEDGAGLEGSLKKVDGEAEYPGSASQPGRMARGRRLMQLLVKNGVEARATEPVPEEVCISLLVAGLARFLIYLNHTRLCRKEPSSNGGHLYRNSHSGQLQTPTFSASQPAFSVPTFSVSISTRPSGSLSSSTFFPPYPLHTLQRLDRCWV